MTPNDNFFQQLVTNHFNGFMDALKDTEKHFGRDATPLDEYYNNKIPVAVPLYFFDDDEFYNVLAEKMSLKRVTEEELGCSYIEAAKCITRFASIKLCGPSMVAYDWIESLIKSMKEYAEKDDISVLEINTGNGAISYALQSRGVNTIATDMYAHPVISLRHEYTTIEDMDMFQAIEKYGKTVDYVITCWPDKRLDMALFAERLHEVNPKCVLIYIGPRNISSQYANTRFLNSIRLVQGFDCLRILYDNWCLTKDENDFILVCQYNDLREIDGGIFRYSELFNEIYQNAVSQFNKTGHMIDLSLSHNINYHPLARQKFCYAYAFSRKDVHMSDGIADCAVGIFRSEQYSKNYYLVCLLRPGREPWQHIMYYCIKKAIEDFKDMTDSKATLRVCVNPANTDLNDFYKNYLHHGKSNCCIRGSTYNEIILVESKEE